MSGWTDGELMEYLRKSPVKLTVQQLDRELVARGAQIPGSERFKFKDKEGTPQRDALVAQVKEFYAAAPSPNKELRHMSTWELVQTLIQRSQESNDNRGIWFTDNRLDFYDITDEQIKKNTNCVAAICLENNLTPGRKGLSTLKNKNYGEVFNLAINEPFRDQPTAAGWLCTGFLVKEDIIATAGHCLNDKDVTHLRFVFGYKMADPLTPVIRVSDDNIYKGVRIIRKVYRRLKDDGADWALVKLDRKVEDQPIAVLSEGGTTPGQSIYVIGYPCGLPLKYAPGAKLSEIKNTHFSADLDIYSGNSGSPVFDKETHEVIGIVVRGDTQDFRWTGKGWLSVIYPNPVIRSQAPQCTKISEFKHIVDKLP